MPIARPEERVGHALLGKYELQSWLATGGMGVLYAAMHRRTGRKVAVKMLRPKELSGALDTQRFLREVRSASLLIHPNVVDVYDADVDSDGSPFMVMELLRGESLGTTLRRRKEVRADEALAWLLPIMGAVATAHDRGLLHRDLKPDNVFLSLDQQNHVVPKLLDFGLSKVLDEVGETRSGIVLGTPSFMAPEQVRDDEEIGPQADVWAMGVMFFLALSGRLPREGGSTTSLLVRIAHEAPQLLSSLAPHVPVRLAAAVDRALEPDLGARYSSMRAFAWALLEAASADGIDLPSQPDPIGLPEWSAWLEAQNSEQQATRSAASVPVRAHEPAPSLRRARSAWIAAALLCAGLAAWRGFAALSQRHEASPTAVVVSASTSAPKLPAPRPAQPSAAALPVTAVAETAPHDAETSASVPHTSAPPRKASAARRQAAPARAASAPAARDTSGATTTVDPLRIETEWK